MNTQDDRWALYQWQEREDRRNRLYCERCKKQTEELNTHAELGQICDVCLATVSEEE